VIFVSYVELLSRLAIDLALKTKYYTMLFVIRNLSEIAFLNKKPGEIIFVLFRSCGWWDSPSTGPANIPHATERSLARGAD
jgi:hypothetical protein